MKTTSLLLLTATAALAQGPLAPTAAPAPTMKTLTQIEPRTPVNSTTCPGDASNTFIITTSGSYYLTGNLAGTAGKRGIYIQAPFVTLDLGGFILDGNFKNGTDAIYSLGGGGNRTAFNGTLANWNGSGISLIGDAASVEHITVTNCGQGIFLSASVTSASHCVVTTCGQGIVSLVGSSTVSDCAVSTISSGLAGSTVYGILGDTVTHCSVKGVSNTNASAGSSGISGKTISQCTVSDVQSAANYAFGIQGTTITDCAYDGSISTATAASYYAISGTTVAHCNVANHLFNSSGNFHNGINGGTVTDCTVQHMANSGSGTHVSGIRSTYLADNSNGSLEACLVKNCNVSGITGDGIRCTGNVNLEGNRIGYCTSVGISVYAGIVRNNTTNNCGTAISLTTGLAVGNTSISDTAGFSLGAAVRSGPLITTGGVSTVFDPNSNFKF